MAYDSAINSLKKARALRKNKKLFAVSFMTYGVPETRVDKVALSTRENWPDVHAMHAKKK